MDEQIIEDLLTEIFSSLEPLDAQSAAILQFLKAKGLATDDELAPFLEQAKNASNVRWLAARVRIGSLLNSALKSAEAKPTDAKPTEAKAASQTAGLPPTASKTEEAEGSKQTNQKNETEETTQTSDVESKQRKPVPAQTSPNKTEQTAQQTATNEDSGEAKGEAPHKDLKETAA
jgi:hypothetical protein